LICFNYVIELELQLEHFFMLKNQQAIMLKNL